MKRILLPLIWLSLLFPVACTTDNDYIAIDFSTTVSVPKPEPESTKEKQLNVAVAAMISPKETFDFYRELLAYLGKQIGRDVNLVQRKTYKEVNDLLSRGEIDMAFICSGPYALEKDTYRFEAIATPVIRGEPYYQSYLIVNKNSEFNTLEDLRHRSFAFTDPDSNTGSLVPIYWLYELGENPDSFFSTTYYTYSHDNSILTVAKSLVDAAAVDGHEWEYFNRRNDPIVSRTRVIKKSEKFGSPPLVVSKSLPHELKRSLQSILLSMHEKKEGKEILEKLLIDRFTTPDEKWYRPIRLMYRTIHSKT
jgi:phosphonate transport system substrate-binding protein